MSLQTINFDHIRLQVGDRLLDLGCGEGRHTISACMARDLDAVGVDLSLQDLKVTRQRFQELDTPESHQKNLLVLAADGARLPFSDGSFDKVICSEVLEHIPDYREVITEIHRVLKAGGLLGLSVPRFFPEWVCWRLSDEYHQVEGGHIRIFNAGHLRDDVERAGFVFYRKHHAHSLHVPYWWLKCLLWRGDGELQASIVNRYHQFLTWDLMAAPRITRFLDRLLNPMMGKSLVMYFVKDNNTVGAAP